MKYLKIFLVLVIMILVPAIVKADGSERYYYTNLLNENIKSNENVEYIVEYSSLEEGMSKNEEKTVYILYDSKALNYVSVEEYQTTTDSLVKASVVKDGVIKLTIISQKEYKKYDIKTLIKFSVNDRFKGQQTIIELKTNYDYEKLTCEDCDGFYLGTISEKNEKRIISISYNDIVEKEITNITKCNNKDNIEKSNILLYASAAFNAILLVTVIVLAVKKNK